MTATNRVSVTRYACALARWSDGSDRSLRRELGSVANGCRRYWGAGHPRHRSHVTDTVLRGTRNTRRRHAMSRCRFWSANSYTLRQRIWPSVPGILGRLDSQQSLGLLHRYMKAMVSATVLASVSGWASVLVLVSLCQSPI